MSSPKINARLEHVKRKAERRRNARRKEELAQIQDALQQACETQVRAQNRLAQITRLDDKQNGVVFRALCARREALKIEVGNEQRTGGARSYVLEALHSEARTVLRLLDALPQLRIDSESRIYASWEETVQGPAVHTQGTMSQSMAETLEKELCKKDPNAT